MAMNRRELHQTDKNPALSLRKQPTERRGFFNVTVSSPKGSGSVRESSVVLSKATFAAISSPSRRVGRTSGRVPGNDRPRPSPGRVCMRSEGGLQRFPCGRRSSSGRAPRETVLSVPRQSRRPVVGPCACIGSVSRRPSKRRNGEFRLASDVLTA